MRTRNRSTRLVSCVLLFSFLLSTVNYAAATNKNTGVRHELCTELSPAAEAYYTGKYTYEDLSALPGDNSGTSLGGTKSELYDALQALMSTTMTNKVTYSSLTSYWPDTDCQPGYSGSQATLFYSDVAGTGYNREHVWPKSRGSFYQSGAGSDLHHLRPTDTNVNSTRGNMTMGNVREKYSNCSTKSYNGKTVLWYNSGADLVEIADNVKGDVARIFLYVYTRWGEPNLFENVSSGNLPLLTAAVTPAATTA